MQEESEGGRGYEVWKKTGMRMGKERIRKRNWYGIKEKLKEMREREKIKKERKRERRDKWGEKGFRRGVTSEEHTYQQHYELCPEYAVNQTVFEIMYNLSLRSDIFFENQIIINNVRNNFEHYHWLHSVRENKEFYHYQQFHLSFRYSRYSG